MNSPFSWKWCYCGINVMVNSSTCTSANTNGCPLINVTSIYSMVACFPISIDKLSAFGSSSDILLNKAMHANRAIKTTTKSDYGKYKTTLYFKTKSLHGLTHCGPLMDLVHHWFKQWFSAKQVSLKPGAWSNDKLLSISQQYLKFNDIFIKMSNFSIKKKNLKFHLQNRMVAILFHTSMC